MIQKQKHRFGGMNQDDDDRDIPAGDYRDGLNIRVGSSEGSNLGVVENIKGSSLVSFSLPAGNNKCIGTHEDRKNNTVFFFLFNDQGGHGIYRYFILTNTIVMIYSWGGLNFQANNLITGCWFIENMLAWTDNFNPPREINIDRAVINEGTPGFVDEEFDMDFVKVPPTFPLVVSSFIDAVSVPVDSELDKKTYTFAYDYVYRDGEQSVMSPMSMSISSAYMQVLQKDTIEINVATNRILKVLDVGMERYNKFISYVNFYFRDSPAGPFKRIKRMKIEDIADNTTLQIPVLFKNDETYPVIDTKISSILFDSVPDRVAAMELSNNRGFLGGVLEGFPEANPIIENVTTGWKVIEPITYPAVPDIGFDHIAMGDYFTFKNFSKYQIGIAYYDRANRNDGVYVSDKLAFQVPPDWRNGLASSATHLGDKYYTIDFQLQGSPPKWATHYQILRTENLSTQFFIQGIIENCIYVKNIDANGKPVIIKKKIGVEGTMDDGNYEPNVHLIDENGANQSARFITFNGLKSGTYYGSENIFNNAQDPANHRDLNIYEGGVTVLGENLVYRQDDIPFTGSGTAALLAAIAAALIFGDPLAIAAAYLAVRARGYSGIGANVGQLRYEQPIGKDIHGAPIYYGGLSGSSTGQPVSDFFTDGLNEATIIWLDIYNWTNTTSIISNAAASSATATFRMMAFDYPVIDGYSLTSIKVVLPGGGTSAEFLPHTFAYKTTPAVAGEYSDYGLLITDLIAALNASPQATTSDGNYVFSGTYSPTGKITITVISPTSNSQNYNNTQILGTGALYDSSVNFLGGAGTGKRTNPSNNTPYIFTKGDRVNLYYKPNGDWLGKLDIEILDFLENRYISIPFQPEFVTNTVLGSGVFIEVFTPRKKDQESVYFEIGECHPVVDPHTDFCSYAKNNFSIWQGDTHKLRGARLYATNIDMNQSDSVDPQKFDVYSMNPDHMHRAGQSENIWERGNGRPNAELAVRKQVFKGSDILYTEPYIQDSNINGLSTIRATNRQTMPHEFGSITKLINASDIQNENTVMLSIHEVDTASLYLGHSLIQDDGNNNQLAASQGVIGSIRPLKAGYGCINPESVVQHNGIVYAWDCKKGVVWRYYQDGQTPISGDQQLFQMGKMKTYFYKKGKALLDTTNHRAFGGFDPYFNEYILTYSDGTTIAFSENIKRWTTRYDFVPEYFCKVNTRLVSFLNGVLWLHGANDLYNNFAGVQYSSKIKIVTNDHPSNVKIFANYAVESSDPWVATDINTPGGQQSSLVITDYEAEEGIFYVMILRDVNTPGVVAPHIPILHGDFMYGQTLSTEFENIITAKSLLFAIDVGYTISKGHKV